MRRQKVGAASASAASKDSKQHLQIPLLPQGPDVSSTESPFSDIGSNATGHVHNAGGMPADQLQQWASIPEAAEPGPEHALGPSRASAPMLASPDESTTADRGTDGGLIEDHEIPRLQQVPVASATAGGSDTLCRTSSSQQRTLDKLRSALSQWEQAFRADGTYSSSSMVLLRLYYILVLIL